jgi:D-sedoheptulose 7-phosphate isomerase
MERMITDRSHALFSDIAHGYIENMSQLLRCIPVEDLTAANVVIANVLSEGRTLFVAGNGGSSAWSSHFATDVTKVLQQRQVKGRIFSLTDNSALLTAFANDYGYDHAIGHLVSRYGQPGDVLLVVSASGNSPNMVNAVKIARENNLATIAFLGFDGGALLELADRACVIATPIGAYGPVEDVHLMWCHMTSLFLREALAKGARADSFCISSP